MTLVLVQHKLKGRVGQENTGAGLTLFVLPREMVASHLCSQAVLSDICFFRVFGPLEPEEEAGRLSLTSPSINTSLLTHFIAPILSADFKFEPQPAARLSEPQLGHQALSLPTAIAHSAFHPAPERWKGN